MSAEPFVTVTVVVKDDTKYQTHAHIASSGDHVIAAVSIGNATIQSTVPGALRRLARALLDAADKADAITTETWK